LPDNTNNCFADFWLKKNNGLKILQIIQRSQLRGAEIFACQLAEQLQKNGHEVDVLVLFGEKSNLFEFPLRFHFLEAKEKKRWWDVGGYKQLNLFIRKGNYDIVQANAGDTLKYASLSKKIFRWKSTLVFRNANKISDFLNSGSKKIIYRWLMASVNYVASVSHHCMLDFLSVFPSFENRISNLPIGVKENNSSPYRALNEIGIDGNGPFILHVAGFMPEKNHAGLLRIFKNILPEFPESRLLLIGEGKLKEYMERLAGEMNLSESVVFLGKRNDVQSIMSACQVFVLPSLIEGLPGVILEAFINRLPVIAYDTGGIKEVVITDETGWLIDQGNEIAFSNALVECLRIDQSLMTENAYRLIGKKYTIQRVTQDFEGAYHRAVK
jgi:glycosyltransferase involved in cell wall biosynthesis